ncbi:MAG: hypothetical protein NZ735_07175 [Candidatus Marinimicrobia bacterium]|nr:hypothetical protein [Candidatus Neomarinimicrobiota bacterium]
MKTLQVNQFAINGCDDKMFVPFFEIDADFLENEEYFRADTLSLGFKNEAERCSKVLFDKFFPKGEYDGYIETLSEALNYGADMSVNGNQFILGNTTYTREYDISLVCTNENEYEVIVASLSN